MAWNSYISDLQLARSDLQSLLLDAEQSNFTKRIRKLENKIAVIESVIRENEKIRIYLKEDFEITSDYMKKKELKASIEQCQNTPNDKQFLINIIRQRDEEALGELALKRFIELMDDNDVDILMRLFFSEKGHGGITETELQIRKGLLKKYPNFNFDVYEKAIMKYTNDKYLSGQLIKDLNEKFAIPENSLIRLRKFFSDKSLKNCVEIIDRILLSRKPS